MTEKATPPPEGSLEALVELLTAELEKVRSEAQEIGLLVDQNRGEVEKLRHRQAAVSTRLKQIQPAFDTVPREDIRAAYETALDAQQRLFNTGGELERLQTKQEVLVRFSKTVQMALDTLHLNKPEAAPTTAAPKSFVVRLSRSPGDRAPAPVTPDARRPGPGAGQLHSASRDCRASV